jgi:hypothetical protein
MGTKVVIMVPESNDSGARVTIEDLLADGTWVPVETPDIRVGHCRDVYVGKYRRVRIETPSESPKPKCELRESRRPAVGGAASPSDWEDLPLFRSLQRFFMAKLDIREHAAQALADTFMRDWFNNQRAA